jgi:4-amino-4-deoxy-L-arabinose transferase-like glycosyltransferase
MRTPALVFLLALASLAAGVRGTGLGSAFTDPVGGIRCQDECFYSHSAMRMAAGPHWLTPRLLGRYFLHKPPLLMWLAALSVKVFGPSLLALRLPVLLAGAAASVIVFLWVRGMREAGPAAAGALLLVSNSLWHACSRMVQTDVLVGTFLLLGLWFLSRDPALSSRSALFGFGISTAAAIMTKSLAGLLPLLALCVFFALARKPDRPPPARLAQLGLVIAAFAMPWHLYQLFAHGRWFWTEYVKVEMLGFGWNPPVRPQEHHFVFYAKRLFLTDPVLSLAALSAAPAAAAELRNAYTAGLRVLLSWITAAAAALLAFRAVNLPYVCYLLPAMCILGAVCSPLLCKRRSGAALIALCAAFAVKASFPQKPWGLNLRGLPLPRSAAALRTYAEKGRPNELVVVSPDDEFYSAVLPIPKVRYCFIDTLDRIAAYGPHFVETGITVTAGDFINLSRRKDEFERRMREWGLDSSEAMATAIVASGIDDVKKILEARPESDFYLPENLRPAAEAVLGTTHAPAPGPPGRFFLLSRRQPPASGPTPGPALAPHW